MFTFQANGSVKHFSRRQALHLINDIEVITDEPHVFKHLIVNDFAVILVPKSWIELDIPVPKIVLHTSRMEVETPDGEDRRTATIGRPIKQRIGRLKNWEIRSERIGYDDAVVVVLRIRGRGRRLSLKGRRIGDWKFRCSTRS
nr:hypothetical protein [Deinococcus betulae]